MLPTLLAKDFRRARRNPVPYLVQLCVPLVITALLGLVFGGGGSDGGGLRRIKFAIVDEDDSLLTGLVRSVGSQGQGSKYLEPVFLARDAALRQVADNQLSAAVIIPTNFTRDYLAGRDVRLQLVKNPAQSFHPAILEELLGVSATGLDALQRNFREDLADWTAVVRGAHRTSLREVSELLGRTADRFDKIRHRLDPLPVYYVKEIQPDAAGARGATGGGFNAFAFLLPGLAAMFLLFLADVAMRDLQREVRLHTFQRYCTLPPGPGLFVASKVAFTFLIVMLGGLILIGGGGLLFGIHWKQPLAVLLLTASLALFASGLLAGLASLTGGERRAEVLNGMLLMLLGLASGCAFPAQALPALLRDHITPWLPPAWFVGAMRAAQFDDAPASSWLLVAARSLVCGLVLIALAAWGFRRRLLKGGLK